MHIQKNLPCEDFSMSYEDDNMAIAVISDGHGDKNCFRSGKGAEIACNTSVELCKKFYETCESMVSEYGKDALENVLKAIHEVLDGKEGKIITVCGAGGNRDKGKRPLMAQEAVKQSDRVIITSDNPRFEEPQDIINDMLAGLDSKQMKKVVSIVDRKEAIRTACMLAQKGDVILIAGKGHEDYQEIKGVKHHFDDREVVKEIFEA